MKKLIGFYLILFTSQVLKGQEPFSCSSFTLSSGDTVVYGRNHDATLRNCLIVFNPKNIYKEGFEFLNEINPKWTSKYSSLTFNVLGVGFAVCGMNEKGLAIGHMGFSEAQYPDKDKRPVLDQIQYITYVLDNCASTKDVIKTAKRIRISDESSTKEHYFICDKSGQYAIIEFIKGEMILYTNKSMPYPLLSNDNYSKSLSYLQKYQGFGGDKPVPERTFGVEEIMAIGCNYIKQYESFKPGGIIKTSLDLLNDIGFNKYPPPDTINVSKDYGTQFSAVFDLKNLRVYFNTRSNQTIRIIEFQKFIPNCLESTKILEADYDATGIVNNSFSTYTVEKNRDYLTNRLSKVDGMPKELIDFLANYPESFKCKK